jgi:predicted glycosyltransferase
LKVLIDIGHPAHVHLFKHFAWEMEKKGHSILFTCRDKEFEIFLLQEYGFKYKSFGKKYKSLIGKILGLFIFDLKEIFTGLKFNPDILLSHGSIYAAHASFILNKPHISLEDTFNFEQIRLYKPFTKTILTADYENPLKSDKVLKYAGYHELAYLHPNKFTPNKDILYTLGVKEGEKYVILRFVSWNASHDMGHKGMSVEMKIKAVKEFSKYAKVFISSEGKLPEELEKFKIKIPADKIHDAIAFSALLFGESSTMSEEAAMLGVPSIFMFNSSTIYTQHLEKEYKLVFNLSESIEDQSNAILLGTEILKDNNSFQKWKKLRDKMLSEKIDVSAFLVWFVDNYPESIKLIKENPSIQYYFK